MRNREIQNERFDEVERNLFEASKLQDDQIERIVASPHLFRSVITRIDKLNSSAKTVRRGVAWNWRLSLAAYSLLAVFLSAAVVFSIYERRSTTPSPVNISVRNEPDRVFNPYISLAPSEVNRDTTPKNETAAQHAIFKTRVKAPEHRRQERVEEVSEFYPLTGDSEGNEGEDQLVRVNLPRSALMAMGVDVPFENNGPKVKTDLLVGSDGVMKAVRFVK